MIETVTGLLVGMATVVFGAALLVAAVIGLAWFAVVLVPRSSK